jgi:ADP-ribose pyrophosphatase
MTDQREIMAEGDFYRFVREGCWEYIEPAGFREAVLIIPVTDDGRLVLVEQFRTPVRAQVLEIPAGLVGDAEGGRDEGVIAAGHRELLEETGYEASSMQVAARGFPSAGSNSVEVTILLATGLSKVAGGGGCEGEDIIVHEVPLPEVRDWLEQRRAEGGVIDLKVFAGLFFALDQD